jgi:hypothetical protein
VARRITGLLAGVGRTRRSGCGATAGQHLRGAASRAGSGAPGDKPGLACGCPKVGSHPPTCYVVACTARVGPSLPCGRPRSSSRLRPWPSRSRGRCRPWPGSSP